MSKDGLKTFPLNRYVVNRDGNGNVLEIVTKELISRRVLGDDLPEPVPNAVADQDSTGSDENDIEVSEVSALVLKDSGISVYDGGFSPYSIQDQFAAIGTGAMAALGVMYVLEALEASVSDDKSVQLAVGTSMRVDPMSGGKIAVRTLVGSHKVLYLP